MKCSGRARRNRCPHEIAGRRPRNRAQAIPGPVPRHRGPSPGGSPRRAEPGDGVSRPGVQRFRPSADRMVRDRVGRRAEPGPGAAPDGNQRPPVLATRGDGDRAGSEPLPLARPPPRRAPPRRQAGKRTAPTLRRSGGQARRLRDRACWQRVACHPHSAGCLLVNELSEGEARIFNESNAPMIAGQTREDWSFLLRRRLSWVWTTSGFAAVRPRDCLPTT